MYLMALTLVWKLIALVFFSFWSCISQSPASPLSMSKSCLSLSLFLSRSLFLSLASLLFILLLTFLFTLKAEVNTWKDWWPFNENVSIPVVGGEASSVFQRPSAVSMTLELSQTQLHVPWQLLNVSFSLPLCLKVFSSDIRTRASLATCPLFQMDFL